VLLGISIGKSSTFPKKKLPKALLACIQRKIEKEKQRREVCELRESSGTLNPAKVL